MSGKHISLTLLEHWNLGSHAKDRLPSADLCSQMPASNPHKTNHLSSALVRCLE
jgi:hypothetical protein